MQLLLAALFACSAPSEEALVEDPLPPEEARFDEVDVGVEHSCARRGGAVWCWGAGSLQQIGDGAGRARPSPTRVPGLPDVVEVELGWSHACARTATGDVWCWGDADDGQSGTRVTRGGLPATRVPGIEGAVQVAVGGNRSCARTKDAVLCWGTMLGFRHAGSPVPVALEGFDPELPLVVGEFRVCQLVDGVAECAGQEPPTGLGSIGPGGGMSASRPAVDQGQPSTDLAAIEDLAELIAAGNEPPAPPTFEPEALPGLRGLTALGLSSRRDVVCGIHGQGAVSCFDGRSWKPVPDVEDAVELAISAEHGCARTRDGAIRCWGDARYGQTGDSTVETHEDARRVAGITGAVEVAVGDEHTCARRADDTVHCWGSDGWGVLGIGGRIWSAEPVPLDLEGVEQVAVGVHQACAVLPDSLHCWGRNEDGQLGVTPRPYRSGNLTPSVQNAPVRADRPRPAEFGIGDEHTCAIDGEGTVTCWGDNHRSKVRPGNRADIREAYTVPGVKAKQLALGEDHTCVLATEGWVWCWGDRDEGQTGEGVRDEAREDPGLVPGVSDAVAIATSPAGVRTCVRKKDRSVACWGRPQIGDELSVTELSRMPKADGLAVGVAHVCALTGGFVHCMGRDQPRGLVQGLPQVDEVAAGSGHTCARADGSVWCWGRNDRAQAGDPERERVEAPHRVAGLDDAVGLALGGDVSCAIREGGRVSCWGNNYYGTLGDGRSLNFDAPQQVVR